MEKKDLLGMCENLNIDIIWKTWKDDIIRTTIDVQDKLAKYDPTVNKTGVVTVTQFVSGYESLEPLPTADPRSERTKRYGLFLKNDLIKRCKNLQVNMGWKSSRDDLIEAILAAEDKAGPSPYKVNRISSTAPPTDRSDDQPMARQKKYYGEKSRNYLKRRCKVFRVSKTKRKPTSQLTRSIMDVECRTSASGMLKAKHIYIPNGPDAPPMPPFGQKPTIKATQPIAQPPSQQTTQQTTPWPEPHQHPHHEDITVIYRNPAPNLVGGTGLPLVTKGLNPVYERYSDQTQMPTEFWYEPLGRTPRMNAAAEEYHNMSLSQLQAIVRARGYTRGIDQDCDTKLDCIDTLLDDDRKHGLLPAARACDYPLEPGKLVDTNPDPEMFLRMPTEMQVEVLWILENSWEEAESFQLSREEFYEDFSQAEMEKEVLMRRVMYAPTVRRQLVRNDMRMFERIRRRRAGLTPRTKVYNTQATQGAAGAAATAEAATTTEAATTAEVATTTAAAATVPSILQAKSVAWASGVTGSG